MRNLRVDEISKLSQQGCSCDAWERVLVADEFDTAHINRCHFSGDIRLGSFTQTVELLGGILRHTGICNASLHNVSVGDNSLIENVHNYISNYDIDSNVIIRNVNHLYVEGESSFGSGVEVSVLNETGGREVLLCDSLSAQLAYFMAFYRQNKALITTIKEMIEAEVRQKRSNRGRIKSGARLYNVGTIRNVLVGNDCTIDGAARLSNGTINSNASDPVFVGNGVMAEDFIFASGAHVSNAAVIVRCFIGQACHIGHLFSAHDSLFFSNCQGENGEACAVFAGPYTVSMHKSSLLIAGYFSFLNAGSGSNQSNHMYKLGPIHQGIVERGSKTTSDSYILWPAKIGAFSLVMGRHVRHSDTSKLPFSYLIEKNDDSYLVPGVNLRSVGTIRDAQKWPKRDKRKDPNRLDCINFNLLSPYTIDKMIRAKEVLNLLQETAGETSEVYTYHSAKIKNSSLKNGLVLYTKAIHKFLGNSIISRLKEIKSGDSQELRAALAPKTKVGLGDWIDVCGLFAPQSEIDRLINRIASREITSLPQIQSEIRAIHEQYYEYEWTWAAQQIETEYGKPLSEYTVEDVVRVVNDWKEAVISLDEMLYQDAKKEFSKSMQIGFGLDAHSEIEKEGDFLSVRGDFENNPFVVAVKQHISDKTLLCDELIERISKTIATSNSTSDTSFTPEAIEEKSEEIIVELPTEMLEEPIGIEVVNPPFEEIYEPITIEEETILQSESEAIEPEPEAIEEKQEPNPEEEETEVIEEEKEEIEEEQEEIEALKINYTPIEKEILGEEKSIVFDELTAEQKERQRRLRMLLSTDDDEGDNNSLPQTEEKHREVVKEQEENVKSEQEEEILKIEEEEEETAELEEEKELESVFQNLSEAFEQEVNSTLIMLDSKEEEEIKEEEEENILLVAEEEEEEETPQENSSFDYEFKSSSVPTSISLGESFEKQLAVDLKKAISLNDKYRFQRLLFDGDAELMNSTFDRINQMSSYEEAIEFLQQKFNWPHDNEDAAYFYSILDKRFE